MNVDVVSMQKSLDVGAGRAGVAPVRGRRHGGTDVSRETFSAEMQFLACELQPATVVLFLIRGPPVVWAQTAHSRQGTQFMRQERAGERGRSAHRLVPYPEPAEHESKTKRGKRDEERARARARGT